jgi:hypothetical protein
MTLVEASHVEYVATDMRQTHGHDKGQEAVTPLPRPPDSNGPFSPAEVTWGLEHYEIRSGVVRGCLDVRRRAYSMQASASAYRVVQPGCCQKCTAFRPASRISDWR